MVLATFVFVVLLWGNGIELSLWPYGAAVSVLTMILAIPIYVFALVILAHWMGRALDRPHRRSWIKIALLTMMWSLANLIAIKSLPSLSGFGARFWFDRDMVPYAIWSIAVCSMLPYVLALSSVRRMREYEEWASLDIA